MSLRRLTDSKERFIIFIESKKAFSHWRQCECLYWELFWYGTKWRIKKNHFMIKKAKGEIHWNIAWIYSISKSFILKYFTIICFWMKLFYDNIQQQRFTFMTNYCKTNQLFMITCDGIIEWSLKLSINHGNVLPSYVILKTILLGRRLLCMKTWYF